MIQRLLARIGLLLVGAMLAGCAAGTVTTSAGAALRRSAQASDRRAEAYYGYTVAQCLVQVLKQAGEEELGHLTKAGSEKTFLKGFFDSNDLNKDGKITREEWDSQLKFLASGKNIAFALNPGGAGDVTKSHVAWTATKGLPYVPSPLVYRGVMYTL